MGFLKKRSSLVSEGICVVLRVYSEVHVLSVSCLPPKIANSMVFPDFMVCRHILFYGPALMLVPHTYYGRWVFLRGVYFLHLNGVCEVLRVYFAARDSLEGLLVCFVFPQNLQMQCYSQVSWYVDNTLFYICTAIDAGTTFVYVTVA